MTSFQSSLRKVGLSASAASRLLPNVCRIIPTGMVTFFTLANVSSSSAWEMVVLLSS